ncbi:hypothetical protein FQR65_LT20917 [Abscondita terminalis]|nr:hypothetical protein FQR65_LT20917 [Abscondita terminalis]
MAGAMVPQRLKAWGAAAAGSMMSSNGGAELAGGGGYATLTLDLQQGQIVSLLNGRGGGGANYPAVAAGAYVGTGARAAGPRRQRAAMHVSGIASAAAAPCASMSTDKLVLWRAAGGRPGESRRQRRRPVAAVASRGQLRYGSGGSTPALGLRGGVKYAAGRPIQHHRRPFQGGKRTAAAAAGGLYGAPARLDQQFLDGLVGRRWRLWLHRRRQGVSWPTTWLRAYVACNNSWETVGDVARDAACGVNTQLLDTVADHDPPSGPKFGTKVPHMNGGQLDRDHPGDWGPRTSPWRAGSTPSSLATGVMMDIGDRASTASC